MEKSTKITDIHHGDNHISVWIGVEPDGSIRVDDSSYGAVADAFYGPASDVDHVLKLDATAVRRLYSALGHAGCGENPGVELAQLLTARFEGEHDALRRIADLCDQHGVPYERDVWVSSD